MCKAISLPTMLSLWPGSDSLFCYGARGPAYTAFASMAPSLLPRMFIFCVSILYGDSCLSCAQEIMRCWGSNLGLFHASNSLVFYLWRKTWGCVCVYLFACEQVVWRRRESANLQAFEHMLPVSRLSPAGLHVSQDRTQHRS